MDIFANMDTNELIRLILTLIIGGAGWVFALGRNMITHKVIQEASQIFVKREIYELEMKNVQDAITALQLEQKTNHADFIRRLDRAVEQINNKIDKIQE